MNSFLSWQRAKNWYLRRFTYCNFRVTQEEAETHYRIGRWDRLWKIDELAHYSLIVGYYMHFHPGGSILDIGCGEGILLERLKPLNYSRYVGVDYSKEAVLQATPKEDAKTFFSHADGRTYRPEGVFDVIVFNESVYYFEDPVGVLCRYSNFLSTNGCFIVSMHINRSHMHAWKLVEASELIIEDYTRVSNKMGVSWLVAVIRPKR